MRQCLKPKGETGELERDLTYEMKLLKIFHYGHKKVNVLQVYGHKPVIWLNYLLNFEFFLSDEHVQMCKVYNRLPEAVFLKDHEEGLVDALKLLAFQNWHGSTQLDQLNVR